MRTTYALLLVGLLAGSLAQAAPRTFVVMSDFPRNKVSFHSKATVESFDGSTRKATGQVVVDPATPGDPSSAWFQVDLASLDTGMELRNQHMRENHLHTDKHPFTRFELQALEGALPALQAGKSATLKATGDFTLHGVTRRRTVPVEVTWYPDGGKDSGARAEVLHLVCRFDVALKEHQIPRPEFLFMKVAESMQVTVDLWAVAK
jgi:polyisoprenoid-binding protein YceI